MKMFKRFLLLLLILFFFFIQSSTFVPYLLLACVQKLRTDYPYFENFVSTSKCVIFYALQNKANFFLFEFDRHAFHKCGFTLVSCRDRIAEFGITWKTILMCRNSFLSTQPNQTTIFITIKSVTTNISN